MTQICKNCNYFRQYYTLFNRHFRKTDKGYCIKTRVDSKNRDRLESCDACKNYIPAEDNAEETVNKLKYCLEQIEKHSEYVSWVLNKDNE